MRIGLWEGGSGFFFFFFLVSMSAWGSGMAALFFFGFTFFLASSAGFGGSFLFPPLFSLRPFVSSAFPTGGEMWPGARLSFWSCDNGKWHGSCVACLFFLFSALVHSFRFALSVCLLS